MTSSEPRDASGTKPTLSGERLTTPTPSEGAAMGPLPMSPVGGHQGAGRHRDSAPSTRYVQTGQHAA